MTVAHRVEDLLRELSPQVLGVLARRYGDFADAEDAVQEALLAAATQWPIDGIPDNPRGWLLTVATRRLTDMWRRDEARRRREDVATAAQLLPAAPAGDDDDSLLLLFLCCHPTLPAASAIPLTLRAVGGLSTAEIARAFLVAEDTMAKRISRAKQRITASKLPFTMPAPTEWSDRLRAVLHVLYLIFNEGYTASSGEQVARQELSDEAIRLTRILYAARSDLPEVAGLLALMLLTDARRRRVPGRTASSCPSTSRTERCGIRRSSPKASPCCARRFAAEPWANTSYKPPSRPCTTKPAAPPRPTGRRSRPSTPCWSVSPPIRWRP